MSLFFHSLQELSQLFTLWWAFALRIPGLWLHSDSELHSFISLLGSGCVFTPPKELISIQRPEENSNNKSCRMLCHLIVSGTSFGPHSSAPEKSCCYYHFCRWVNSDLEALGKDQYCCNLHYEYKPGVAGIHRWSSQNQKIHYFWV